MRSVGLESPYAHPLAFLLYLYHFPPCTCTVKRALFAHLPVPTALPVLPKCRRHYYRPRSLRKTGSVLVEIEEPAAGAADGGGSSMPAQAFLSSEAGGDGEPEFSVPRSSWPAEAEAAAVAAAAAVSVPAPAGVLGPGQGGEVLNGGAGGAGDVGTGVDGSARRQVSQEKDGLAAGGRRHG